MQVNSPCQRQSRCTYNLRKEQVQVWQILTSVCTMWGLCSLRLFTVWKTSKIPSAFTRSRTVLKAQKVPVRPAPALWTQTHARMETSVCALHSQCSEKKKNLLEKRSIAAVLGAVKMSQGRREQLVWDVFSCDLFSATVSQQLERQGYLDLSNERKRNEYNYLNVKHLSPTILLNWHK